MYLLRIKLEPDRRENWTCFFCCHVRTATICFGVWHVMLQIMALTELAVVMNHPEAHEATSIKPTNAIVGLDDDTMETPLPTPLSTTNNYAKVHVYTGYSFICFISAIAMIYGAVKGKPYCVLPYFGLKLFHFCISCIAVLAYICFIPSTEYLEIKDPIYEGVDSQFHEYSPATKRTIILLFVMLALTLQAYILSIIWRCYRFLSLRRASGRATVSVLGTPGMSEFGPDLLYAPCSGLGNTNVDIASGSRNNGEANTTTTTALMDNPPEYSKLKDCPVPRPATPPPPYTSVVHLESEQQQQQPLNNNNNS